MFLRKKKFISGKLLFCCKNDFSLQTSKAYKLLCFLKSFPIWCGQKYKLHKIYLLTISKIECLDHLKIHIICYTIKSS